MARSIVPASDVGPAAADAAYQHFRTQLLSLPPWSIWEDDLCAGPISVWLTREVLDDYAERMVFGALTEFGCRQWSLSRPLAEALLEDAEARLPTIQLECYSRTVGARIVTAYRTLTKRIAKELTPPEAA